MPWTLNFLNYPDQMREVYIRAMESGEGSVHTFTNKEDAKAFRRMIQGLRYAFSNSKKSAYREKAPGWTTEKIDDLTIRICHVTETERARIGNTVLTQRREQDKARGIELPEWAPIIGTTSANS